MSTYSWKPSDALVRSSNIARVMRETKIKTYQDFWQWSVKERSQFWDTTIKTLNIPFKKLYSQVFDLSNGVEAATWLPNAELNIVDACFQNAPESAAIVFQKESSDTTETVTQRELEQLVNRIANSLIA